MPKLYQNNVLTVKQVDPSGVHLEGGLFGSVTLQQTTTQYEVGERVEVFLFRNALDQVVAAPKASQIQVGQCAYLEVVSQTDYGAFLHWGLPKDLLMPFANQTYPVQVGERHVVYIYMDRTNRPVATTKLHHHLQELQGALKVGQAVDLMIADDSDLGYKAIINNQQLGLIYHDELSQPLNIGSKLKGWVKGIRKDGKIDLNVNVLDKETRDELEDEILHQIKENGGRLLISDSSSPEEINQTFGVSKKNFKRALGSLYKKHLIKITPEFIESVK